MKLKLTILAVLAICILGGSALAATKVDAGIIDYGIYHGIQRAVRNEKESPTGRVREGNVELVKQTLTITATQETLFGYRFVLTDDLKKRPLKFVYLFPEMKNPRTGKTFSSYEKSGFENTPQ